MHHRRRSIVHRPCPGRRRKQDLLERLSRALAEMQPVVEIGRLLAEALPAMAGLERLALATYAPAARRFDYQTVVVDGQAQQWPSSAADDHPFAPIVRRCEPTPIAPGRLSVDDWLALPLCFAGSAVGVLAVGPIPAAERHQPLLSACANLVATAIYTLQQLDMLESTITDQASTIAGISEIARQLNATLDIQQIVDLLLVHALGVTTTCAGAVLLMTPRQTFELRAQRGIDPEIAARLQAVPLSVADLAEADLNREYQLLAAERVPAHLRLQQRQMHLALLPIRREDRLLGLLLIAIAEGSSFSPVQLRFLEQLTGHAALALSNARAYSEIADQHRLLDRRLAQLQAVSHISQAISAHLNPEALMPEIVAAVQSTLGYRSALLSLVDPADPELLRRTSAIGIPPATWEQLRDQVVPLAYYRMLMTDDFRISQSFYVPHNHARLAEVDEVLPQVYRADLGETGPNEWHPDDLLLVPLYGHQGSLVGMLVVDDPADRQRPTPEMITVLEIFAMQAATAIENARLYAMMEHQALTDNLTGLANQRHFMMHLAQHTSWAERHGQGLAVLAIDIDHFKQYNDSYGHLVGNVLLREFARVIQRNVRSGDLVARWGGEEFTALLPQSTLEGALDVAERIRSAVESYAFPHREISVSVGVAVYVPGMQDQEFLEAADAALYRAKAQRNVVSI